jgi:hypothetical protein
MLNKTISGVIISLLVLGGIAYGVGPTTIGEWASDGPIAVGGATSINAFSGQSPSMQIDNGSNTQGLSITRSTDNQFSGTLFMGKSRGTNGSPASVVDNDILGDIKWQAHDGTDFFGISAQIRAEIDGTTGTGDVPGALVFYTTSDSADTPTERFRIVSSGQSYFAHSIRATNGAASDPGYGFTSSPNTGIYLDGGNISFARGGNYRQAFTDFQILTNHTGTAATPAFSFISDSDTGMMLDTVDSQMAIVQNATQRIIVTTAANGEIQFKGNSGQASANIAPGGFDAYLRTDLGGSSPTVCHAGAGTVNAFHECGSAKRLKKNIRPITDEEAKRLYEVTPVYFDWKKDDTADYGLIADDMLKTFPELVNYNADGEVSSFNYRHFGAINTKVIQMHKDELNNHKREINQLRLENGIMKAWICTQADAPANLCEVTE